MGKQDTAIIMKLIQNTQSFRWQDHKFDNNSNHDHNLLNRMIKDKALAFNAPSKFQVFQYRYITS